MHGLLLAGLAACALLVACSAEGLFAEVDAWAGVEIMCGYKVCGEGKGHPRARPRPRCREWGSCAHSRSQGSAKTLGECTKRSKSNTKARNKCIFCTKGKAEIMCQPCSLLINMEKRGFKCVQTEGDGTCSAVRMGEWRGGGVEREGAAVARMSPRPLSPPAVWDGGQTPPKSTSTNSTASATTESSTPSATTAQQTTSSSGTTASPAADSAESPKSTAPSPATNETTAPKTTSSSGPSTAAASDSAAPPKSTTPSPATGEAPASTATSPPAQAAGPAQTARPPYSMHKPDPFPIAAASAPAPGSSSGDPGFWLQPVQETPGNPTPAAEAIRRALRSMPHGPLYVGDNLEYLAPTYYRTPEAALPPP